MPRLGRQRVEIFAVRAMHPLARMISKKTLNTVLKSAIAVMPAIPYITKKRKSMVVPFVLGGLGVALMGGMAAVMFLSPRTRYRALDMAKNTYGKLEPQIGKLTSQITQLRNAKSGGSMDESTALANGMGEQPNGISGYSTTGL